MEERDQILIDLYLAGELEEAQRLELEQRKSDDPLFRKEFLEYEIAAQALRASQRKELEKRIRKLDSELDDSNSNKTGAFNKRTLWNLLATAAVVLSFLAWRFLFQSGSSSVPGEIIAGDSLNIKKPSESYVQNPDTADVGKEPSEYEKQDKGKKEKYEKQKEEQVLYAEYFEPYKDNSLDPIVKGEEAKSALDRFRLSYWVGRYQETVNVFPELSAAHQDNNGLRFIYANALTAISRYSEAETILVDILEGDKFTYTEEAHWYLGLVYLKQGKKDLAIKQFRHCAESVNGYNKKEAKELLKTLQ